jgi:phenazine biosynthesis protein phzE
MNPISGTYRYPPDGPTTDDVLRFLADGKEAEELYMVVDEELKMLGRVCDLGARLTGPCLTGMAHLAHTEYTLAGSTDVDVRELLRETMFAPTVIGSPLANACRVVARYEPRGRGYYGGVLALVGQRDGRRTLDSSILIRTADLTPDGALELGVGATLVRRSDPVTEVAETRAKAAAMLAAISATPRSRQPATGPREDPRITAALVARNERLNGFWLTGPVPPAAPVGAAAGRRSSTELAGRTILVVDAGDAFTVMLGHLLRATGAQVAVEDWRAVRQIDGYDAVVVGPGPGNPCATRDPKIAALRTLTRSLLAGPTPFLSVCLGHQVLAGLLGLPLRPRPEPAQGQQREIDFFGRTERVGFYNTFAAYAGADRWYSPLAGVVDVCRDRTTGEVYGLRAPGTRSVQFHPESLLTEHGESIVRDLIASILPIPAIR